MGDLKPLKVMNSEHVTMGVSKCLYSKWLIKRNGSTSVIGAGKYPNKQMLMQKQLNIQNNTHSDEMVSMINLLAWDGANKYFFVLLICHNVYYFPFLYI